MTTTMMMIVDLYSALRRVPLLPVHCEKECLQCWSKRSDAERWIREPDSQTYRDDDVVRSADGEGRSETLTSGNV